MRDFGLLLTQAQDETANQNWRNIITNTKQGKWSPWPASGGPTYTTLTSTTALYALVGPQCFFNINLVIKGMVWAAGQYLVLPFAIARTSPADTLGLIRYIPAFVYDPLSTPTSDAPTMWSLCRYQASPVVGAQLINHTSTSYNMYAVSTNQTNVVISGWYWMS